MLAAGQAFEDSLLGQAQESRALVVRINSEEKWMTDTYSLLFKTLNIRRPKTYYEHIMMRIVEEQNHTFNILRLIGSEGCRIR